MVKRVHQYLGLFQRFEGVFTSLVTINCVEDRHFLWIIESSYEAIDMRGLRSDYVNTRFIRNLVDLPGEPCQNHILRKKVLSLEKVERV